MESLTLSFYSKKLYANESSAIKGKGLITVEVGCNPSLNALVNFIDAIGVCAGTDAINAVGIIFNKIERELPQAFSYTNVLLQKVMPSEIPSKSLNVDGLTKVDFECNASLNDIIVLIEAICKCADLEGVVNVAGPISWTIDPPDYRAFDTLCVKKEVLDGSFSGGDLNVFSSFH